MTLGPDKIAEAAAAAIAPLLRQLRDRIRALELRLEAAERKSAADVPTASRDLTRQRGRDR